MKLAVALALLLVPAVAAAQDFTYDPPGDLVPGSGTGRYDETVYAPDMRFPIESPPAFANSQVWGRGGSSGGGGSQCDAANFVYPWHDNYCESRSWDMPLCPSGTGHQGQDIRAASCDNHTYWVVAVEDGTITSIGSYSVYLTTADGTRFDYLHMADLLVHVGDHVTRGQHLGKVSNQFGDSSTTVHLHFNIRQNVLGVGMVYVPPYLSLVGAYQRLLGVGQPPDAGVPDGPEAPPPLGFADASPTAGLDDGAEVAGGCAVGGGDGSPLWALLALLGCARRKPR